MGSPPAASFFRAFTGNLGEISPRSMVQWNVPAICVELKVHINGDGTPVVNSRDVAEVFDKRHADVLRDIDAIKIDADLRRSWFREVQSEHPTTCCVISIQF